MTPQRIEKFKAVVAQRQPNLTVILENVTDLHNIGAVLRSCDSVGIMEVYILYTEPGLKDMDAIKLGRRTSSGTRKWLDVHYFTDAEACFTHVKSKYSLVLGTHLHEQAISLYELNLTNSVALLFGNEKDGISAASQAYCDGNFVIPQVGMAESLNISVACAVTLYEAYRQRMRKGMYEQGAMLDEDTQANLYNEYLRRHEEHINHTEALRKND